MINTDFEAYKLKREIKRSGSKYVFKRNSRNSIGEIIEEKPATVIGSLRGIYHEQNSNVLITTGDTTQSRTKKIPMILCLYEEAASLNFKVGDFVIINSKKFKITGVVNIQEWNIIADISLEVVDNGIQTQLCR